MDIVDRDMVEAEREATRRYSGAYALRAERRRMAGTHPEAGGLARADTRDSALTSTSGSSTDRERDMTRIATASGADITRVRTHPVEASRTETHRLQHIATVGASLKSKASTGALPNFGGGKPYPPALPPYEDYVVEYDGPDDPLHPQNWPMKRKVGLSIMLAYTCFCSTFTSSIFSASTAVVSKRFHVSSVVATLSTSLYVLGYAFGPLIWGPFSELKGRKIPICVGMFGFTIFCFAAATAENLQTLMLCRFFTGFFGSCPLAVVAAIFADMFNNKQRGTAIVVFASTVFLGPMLGPFVGGFVQMSYLGWRWNLYFPGIMGVVATVLNLIFLKESYPPIVLVSKAAELRRRTKNWGIHAKQEEVEVDLKELMTKNFTRPLRLLATEPVVLLVTIYMSFIYGLLYAFLTAYPLVFSGVHGFNQGEAGLTFFGMVAGIAIVAMYIVWDGKNYNKKLEANNGIPIPEWRLPPVMIGGVLFSVGLFWFGWTGYLKSIPWIVPALSGLCTGFGLLAIFIQLFNYILDSYLMFAASAISANTFLRSVTAAGFPLFAHQMFDNLGIEWAATLLGCLTAIMVPIPIMFYFFGAKLRAKSKFAPTKKKPEEGETSGSDESDDHTVALHATRSRVAGDDTAGSRSWASSQTQTQESSPMGQRNGTTVEEANAAHQADLEKGLSRTNGNVEPHVNSINEKTSN